MAYCSILTSDPVKHAIPKTAEVLYSVGMGELGWQYGTGLTSHGTVTNWCTGREWPMNCMTVISARWQSNMPFQRRRKCIFRWPVMGRYWVGVELLYNSVHRKVLEIRELEKWCCSENSTQQRDRPPGLRLSSPWERERNAEWRSICCSLCSVSNSLSHTTLSNKDCVVRYYYCVIMILYAWICIWVCNTMKRLKALKKKSVNLSTNSNLI